MSNKEQEELRKQLLEINISLALLEKTENYLYNSEYRELRFLKIKLIKLIKKTALKIAKERLIDQESEEGRKRL